MTNKFLFIIIAIFLACNFAFAQSKTLTKKQLSETEYIASEHIILLVKSKQINIFNLETANVTSILGKPKKIKKEKSEIDEQIHSVYVYDSGEVDFDVKGNLYGLEIKKQGWAFILKVDDKILKPFNIGTSLNDLRTAFPHHFTHVKTFKNEDMYSIELITQKKIAIESYILFGVKDGIITYMSLAEDES